MTQSNVIPFPIQRVGAVSNDKSDTQQCEQNVPLAASASVALTKSGVFDIQNYLPKGEAIFLLENGKGVQIIPHKIFEFIVKTAGSRVELCVFACLIRYSLGFHRSTCEASNSFISEWTGLAPTSVRRGLEGLLERHLIRCLKVGVSFKDCTVYEIPVIKGYLEYANTCDQPKQTDSLSPVPAVKSQEGQLHRQEAQYPAQFDQYSANRGRGTLPTGGDKKHNPNKTEETKNTNSIQNEFSENLRVYFSSLKSRNKKARELEHFDSLKQRKSLQQISESLEYVLKNGLPGSGERCFAPMAFLNCSIDIVLSYVQSQQKKIKQKEAHFREQDERKRKEEQDAEKDRAFDEWVRKFDEAFPTKELQDSYINRLVERYPILNGNPLALKNLAVSEWVSQQQK